MYVVTVLFTVHADRLESFRTAMAEQAANSLALEPDCHQFDVCESPEDPCRVFLYEIYADRAAFDAHLASEHFQRFDETVRDWIASKSVDTWHRLAAAGAG